MFPKTTKEIVLTAEPVADTGLPREDRDETVTFPTLKDLTSPTGEITPERATISGISLKFASQKNRMTANVTEVPVHSVVMKKNANMVAEPNIPAVTAKHVPIVAEFAISGTKAVLDGKIETK